MSLYRGPERRASTAGPIIDVLSLMQCPEGMHLEGTHKIYTFVTPNRIFTIKSAKGFPWDVRNYDANYLYQFCTELDWTSPKDYKRVVNTTATPFMYRYAYSGDIVVSTDSAHEVVQGCKVVRTFSLGGVQHEFHGPFTEDIGGDIGTVDVYKILYRWSGQPDGTFKVQETFTYAPGFGQVGWQTQNWNYTTGQYDPPTSVSQFNLVVPGTVPLNCPCFV